ncbi:MAG TPA: RidA family protein [Phycisphaerales bacterium]|nr:RidA family protein [Phycisphaerales bacterium]
MPDIASRLQQLSLTLPTPSKPVANYIPAVSVPAGAKLLYISGQVPLRDGKLIASGVVPSAVSIEQAQTCARQCVLNALAAAQMELGSLDKIRRVVRIGVFVACDATFTEHPKVGNGASDLLVEIFGEAGKHARAAVGVPCLPLGAPVEVEFVFEVA